MRGCAVGVPKESLSSENDFVADRCNCAFDSDGGANQTSPRTQFQFVIAAVPTLAFRSLLGAGGALIVTVIGAVMTTPPPLAVMVMVAAPSFAVAPAVN